MIYISTHKKLDFLSSLTKPYVPILAGAYKFQDFNEYLRDDVNDNISTKNQNYSELTSLFWIWKNIKDSYKGLVHYRRFLLSPNKKALTGGYVDYCKNKSYSFEKFLLSELDLKDLDETSVYLPQKSNLNLSCRKELEKYVYKKDIVLFQDFLCSSFPEVYDLFMKILAGNSACYFNVLVAPANIFNSYCSWLFKILFSSEPLFTLENYDIQHKRIFGYFSEILLNVYFQLHPEVKIIPCKMIFLKDNKFAAAKSLIKNILF